MTMIKAVGLEFGTLLEVSTYFNYVAVSNTRARSGTYSLRIASSTAEFNSWAQIPFTESSEIYMQWARYNDVAIGGTTNTIMALMNGSTMTLQVKAVSGGQLQLYAGASLLGTSTNNIGLGAWFLIEVHYKPAESGIAELRINGNLEISFSGDTRVSAITSVTGLKLGSSPITGGTPIYSYDDDIIINDVNGSVNNSWPDGLKIVLLKPTADGTHEEWTPSTGTDNYALVDELPPVITDYLEAGSDGLRDTYVIQNCPAGITSIAAVIPSYWCQKSGTPACDNIKRLMRISGTDYAGSDMAVPSAYGLVQEILEVSPDTSNPFTESEVNGLEFGQQSAT